MVLDRAWEPGDVVELNLPMPVARVAADPRVESNIGKLAIQRGPLVYCLEAVDQYTSVSKISLSADAELSPERAPDLLGGIVTLAGEGKVAVNSSSTGLGLYRTPADEQPVRVTAIPYYAWDNRAAGEMAVWIPRSAPQPAMAGLEKDAAVTMSFAADTSNPDACRDGVEVLKSSDEAGVKCHWWPHKGGQEWVQYTWPAPQVSSSARLFWFDDTGQGQCRVPAEWRLEYQDGEQWRPVTVQGEYPVELDQWCEVSFEPVETKAMRLVVQMQPGWAAGVHEWQVFNP
jgi:hypothetical protein